MKELRLAESAGFCFGVRRSVEMAERLMAERGSCCSLGELIHNEDVVERLKAQGLRVIQSPEEAQRGEQVLIRAHGVAREVYEGLPNAARPSRMQAAQRSRPSMPSSAVPPVRGASSSSSECARIPRWRASAAGAAAMPCLKMHASFPHGWTQMVTTGQNL